MRIALLTHQWPGARMGGIGSAVRQIASSLAVAGHEVHAFTLTLPDDVRADLPAGVTVHEVPSLAERGENNPALLSAGEGAYRLAIAWLLCDAMVAVHRDRPFDIVEAPEVEALGLPLLLNAMLAPGLPVVTHLHLCTAISDQTNSYSPRNNAEQLVRDLEFAAITTADGICGPSRNVIELTRELVNVRDDVQTIPYPFNAGNERHSPPSSAGDILFIGRIERRKGVIELTEALNRFLPNNPTTRFCIAGPDTSTAPGGGSMRNWIIANLNETVRDRVRFTGELSPAQVSEALTQCRFCVLPSVSENFSVALCETMAAGRTAVVFDRTGSPEIVGDAGLIVPQGLIAELSNAMQRLCDEPTLLNDLSQRAYLRIRALCDPLRVGQVRAAFYADIISRKTDENRLEKLPPRIVASVLSGLSAMTGAMTQVPLALPQNTPGGQLLSIMNRIGAGAQVWLYGAGKHTQRLLAERDLWERQGYRVAGLIDDHPRFANGATHLNLPIVPLTKFISRQLKSPVVLSTDTYQDQFWDQTAPLREMGVSVYKLYSESPGYIAA